MPGRYKLVSVVGALLLALVLGCDYSPTGPFEGFDGQGSRVSGSFVSDGGTASGLRATAQTTYDGMTIHLQQDPSIKTSVQSNGTFTLVGIPDGRVTLVFRNEVRILGEIVLDDVRPNQEIRIVVELTVEMRVVLVSASSDQVDFSVSCARSPSFWCKAAQGRSSTLSQEEFLALAEEAADALSGVAGLESAEGVADAVCGRGNDRDRFLRELAALALNLAAGLDRDAPLEDEEFETIGDAFDRAVEIAQGTPSPGELGRFTELLEEINDNENTSLPGCDDDGSEDDKKSDDEESDDDDPSSDDNSGSASGSSGG